MRVERKSRDEEEKEGEGEKEWRREERMKTGRKEGIKKP